MEKITFDNLPEAVSELHRKIDLLLSQSGQDKTEQQAELLSAKEARKILRITDPTLLRLERSGELQSVRIGSKKFFRNNDVQKFLNR